MIIGCTKWKGRRNLSCYPLQHIFLLHNFSAAPSSLLVELEIMLSVPSLKARLRVLLVQRSRGWRFAFSTGQCSTNDSYLGLNAVIQRSLNNIMVMSYITGVLNRRAVEGFA